MAPYSPAPLPFNSAGSHESQRHSWTSGMPGRPTDSFRFNSSRAPARPGRRLPKRLVVMLIFLVFVLLADALWLHSLIFTRVEGGRAELAAVEQGLIDLLVKQKEALEANPPVEEIQAYADRFKVLLDLDRFQTTLNESSLNSTTHDLYSRSITYHHEQLFAKLFPYISRSAKSPRTFEQLLSRYTRPRGIVIPCGNDQFQYAIHLVATLKNVHRTKLPITIVHAGGNDLSIERRAALRSIHPDVETVDVLHFFDEKHVGIDGGGWAIKVFTILASAFQEVIICDADVVFLQDPEVLFQDPGYNRTGTLFFRDREIFPGDGNVHEWWAGIMEGRKPSEQMLSSRWYTEQASREEMESGVVVINKKRREVALGLVYTGYLNIKAVREPVTYAHTYGDKESFWMSFELAGIPYYFDSPYAAIVGQLTHPDARSHSIDSRICSEHLFHLDYKGRPLWWNGSLFQEKRVKDHGWFIATHWAPGTVDWDCEPEPWCMKGIREEDVRKLGDTDGFDRVLTDMVGAAVVIESRFGKLIDKHY